METASGTTHWIKQWLKNEDSIIFRACLEKCLHSHFTAGNLRHEEITGLKLLFQRRKPCKTSHGFQFCCCLELKTRVTSTPHSFLLFSVSCSCSPVFFMFCYLFSKAKNFTGSWQLARSTCPFDTDFLHHLGIGLGDEQLYFQKLSEINHCQDFCL